MTDPLSRRVRAMRRSDVRDLLRHAGLPDMISLAGGLPAAELFDVEGLRAATLAAHTASLAQLLQGFEVQILYHDLQVAPPETEARLRARRVGLDELLASSDILSLHAPLTEATRHVINAQSLASMKAGAILINTSRGGLIDEAALCAALQSGHLRGAGLDAFDPEPPARDNPLLALEQVVVTPHAGGGVFDNVVHVARHAFGNLTCWQRGQAVTGPDLILAPSARSEGVQA